MLFALGVPFAVALGLIVAILDLIPLAGATLAAIIVDAVAFITRCRGDRVMVFFIVYQQVENHVSSRSIYRRTVQLSPLAILIAVLVGAEVAGILGALAAIPVAGAIQVSSTTSCERAGSGRSRRRRSRRAAACGRYVGRARR